jgi:hypothetical protein
MDGAFAGELSDMATYYRQDADNADQFVRDQLRRMAIVGNNVSLSPETTYYYRLQCGGDTRRGSITTMPVMSGSADQNITREVRSEQSAAMEVEYGASYSRFTDGISNRGTVSTSCAAGETCSVSFPAQRGTVVYYRWRELDGSGNVLYSSEVSTLAVF